jgi:WD40 repeat protein
MNREPGEHLHPDQLSAFGLGLLAPEQTIAFESHVAGCAACCQALLSVPDDALVSKLRHAVCAGSNGIGAMATAVVANGAAPDAAAGPAPVALELAAHPRYRVEQLLGAGGMGAVYRAYHRVMERTVALKVINPALLARSAVVDRFTREVKAAARLSHPNIVTAFDADQAGGTHFLVMEFVEGTDLGRHVQESGPLSVESACDYVRQAALGLQHAFEQGMVHRDLKPHNLMLTPDGRVKILDFGMARFGSEATADAAGESASQAAAEACATGTGLVLGTVDYIAPEQAKNAHQADIRSDIYSLGCTLYLLIAGQAPFPGGSATQKVMAHLHKKPQPLSELRHDIPEELMLVLERMITKNPKDRFQTPAEVATALEPFTVATALTRAPRSLSRGRTMDRGRQSALAQRPLDIRTRRRPLLTVAAGLLFLAGLLGAGVYHIATDRGDLFIETDNDDVEVVISKGGEVVKIVDTKSGKHVTLRSGEYELALKDGKDGLRLSVDKITVRRDDTVLAKITRRAMPGGLVGWWQGNGNGNDSVGRNHGTLKGGVKFALGVAGHAFDFNGIDGRVEVGKAPSLHLSSGDFSVSAWVDFRSLKRPPENPVQALPGDMHIVSKVLLAGEDGWCLLKQDDNHFWFGFGGGKVNGFRPDAPTTIRSTTSVVPGVWYHVVAVKTAEHFSLYVNGLEEVSKPLPAFKDTNTANLHIGAWAGAHSNMCGLIDEVKIYSRALSPAEIKAHYSALAPAEKVGEVRCFEGHTGPAYCVAYSRDGRYAVSGSGWPSEDYTIRLWDITAGKQIGQFLPHYGQVFCVDFSPDGRRILYGAADNTAVVLDVATGKEVWKFRGDVRQKAVYDVRFSPNGRHVLLACEVGTAIVCDPEENKIICKFEGHGDRVMSAVFTPDGQRALSGAINDTIYLWDAKTGEKVRSFEGHKGGVQYVAISPDGRYVLAGSNEGKTRRLWDVATGKLLREFIGHEGNIMCVAFSGDGRRAISCSSDKTVRLWDVATGKQLYCFTGHTDTVWRVAFSPDDRYVLSASQDKTLRLWRLPDPPPDKVDQVREFKGHKDGARAAAFFKDGKRFVSCGFDRALRVWDVGTGEELACLQGHTAEIDCLALSSDQQHLLSGGADGTMRLWDVETSKELHCFEKLGRVISLAISADGRWALSGTGDGTGGASLRLWDLKHRKEVHCFDGHTGPVQGVAFSQDGRRAASASWDKTIRLWDLDKRTEIACLTGHTGGVNFAAFSPDGSLLLSGGGDNTVRFWDTETGKELRSATHEDFVCSVAFSPDGLRALSASADGTVRLWDMKTANELHRFAVPKTLIGDARFSPDGQFALSCGADQTIRLWRLPPQD